MASSRKRAAVADEIISWLDMNYELSEGVCLPRSLLYQHYSDACLSRRASAIGAAAFGKVCTSLSPFPDLIPLSADGSQEVQHDFHTPSGHSGSVKVPLLWTGCQKDVQVLPAGAGRSLHDVAEAGIRLPHVLLNLTLLQLLCLQVKNPRSIRRQESFNEFEAKLSST